jgi:hypothetical protein
MLEILNIKGYVFAGDEKLGPASYPTLAVILIYLGLLLNPMHFGHKTFRYELLLSLYYTVIAPFGLVRFKDFFFGDILTSMSKPMSDLLFIVNYFNFQQI